MCSMKGLVPGICKELSKHNSKIMNNLIRKLATDVNGYFTNIDILMVRKDIKKWSASLTIRDMQPKTTMRNHYTPIRVNKIKIVTLSTGETTEKLDHSYISSRTVTWCKASVKQFHSFLKKTTTMKLPYDTAVTFLGTYPREMKTYIYIKSWVY